MQKEWNELVAIFHKNVELHKHLHRFQEIPQQFIDDVKKLYSFWKFQTKFIEEKNEKRFILEAMSFRSSTIKVKQQ